MRQLCAMRLLIALLIASATALVCENTRAQSQTPPSVPATQVSATLASIAQSGSQKLSSEQVAELSGLHIGENVTREAIQNGANRLAQSGYFSMVRYRFDTDNAGIHATYQLQDAPTFPAVFDNFPWFTDEQLAAMLKQNGTLFFGVSPAAGGAVEQIKQGLEKIVETKGLHVTANAAPSLNPLTGEKVIRYKQSGANVEINSATTDEPLAKKDQALMEQINALAGTPYSRETIAQFEVKNIQPIYLSAGFLKLHFGEPQIRMNGNNKVNLTLQISPGQGYTWGGTTWSGNSAYTTADLNSVATNAGLVNGQVADGMKIKRLWNDVRAAYAHRGYLDATVMPDSTFNDAAHSVSYTVNISEGAQYKMGKLVLTGLAPNAGQKLRQAWRISPAQVFDQTYYQYFVTLGIPQALKGLPAAQDTVGKYLQKNPDHTVDVMLDFE